MMKVDFNGMAMRLMFSSNVTIDSLCNEFKCQFSSHLSLKNKKG